MDIVKFWKDQVDLWNIEPKKCGMCFEFAAPLVNSKINTIQNETCCVQIFITDIVFRENVVRNSVTGLTTSKTCVDTFILWALQKSELGVNNYNEIKGHPIGESKWNNIFLPLKECLSCGNVLDTCEILGQTNVNIDLTNASMVHSYLDEAYNGWKVNYTFTQIT